ncbi:MAG: Pyrrolo-quinoline quinone, partial [Bryobacterales bacterium]|nr:Pyrrolo-quinoline quinone [Bryobacterales bacterium]
MTIKKFILAASASLIPALLTAQALDPSVLTKPLGSTDAWPTYSGDYSGKRFSSVKQINQTNVKSLTLSWVSRVTPGTGGGGRGGAPVIIGGEGSENSPAAGGFGGSGTFRNSILHVGGVLYAAMP